ncbi:MAG: dethiobiotin synthase [Bacteroidota bacterium]|nr:dethiobiotin synthase [Bacteroidota bacterium]MDP4232310.1 dethiobiotin synthase [Bacteroidota bacterium]MDP4241449.1 dethiobiotin synthase [Bacteroidota bacterium]MDP4286727.1 dethiobiotin synthase [Bacteroidota bacterium]
MRGVIIAGTDTNVGKTVLSALLMSAMPDAVYWKPVQSGLDEETDSEVIARLSESAPGRILPEAYRLKQPLSPHLSARLDGIQIESIRLALPETEQFIIVETAGGVLVPLRKDLLQIDLMRHWKLPVLLASRSTLGTINHSLLTLDALRARDIPVAGVVMIGPPNVENELAVEQIGNACILGRIPHLAVINRLSLLDVYQRECESLRDMFIIQHS